MAFRPQLLGNSQWVNLALLPPAPLITRGVIFVMVDGAQRHSSLAFRLYSSHSLLGTIRVAVHAAALGT
jgi:hypothetical protein